MTQRTEIGRLPDRAAIKAILRAAPPTMVEEAITEAQAAEQRTRALPAWLVVYSTLALWLWPDDGYETVLARLADGLAWAGYTDTVDIPRASSIARARDRLGPEPLRILFRRLIPLTAAPSAIKTCRDLNVLSLDNTQVKTPKDCGFTGAHIMALADHTGTLLAATWAPTSVPATDPDGRLTRPLLHAMPTGTLVVTGTATDALWHQLTSTGAHLLAHAPAGTAAHQSLSDGTHLTDLHNTQVRLIPARADTPALATTLTDPADAPAHDLAKLHITRWRATTLISHITNKVTPPRLRSVTGFGADQELWALLCVYQALTRADGPTFHSPR